MAGALYLFSVGISPPNLQASWYVKSTADEKAVFDRLHGASHLRLSQAGKLQ